MKFPFSDTEVDRLIAISSHEIHLKCHPNVFIPSSHGIFYAQHCMALPGDKALDIGTGSGVLAILMAKQGAIVTAIDNSEEAIECARANAHTNNAELRLIKCDISDPVYYDKYDVITANLPQEIIPPDLINAFGPARSNAIAGGPNGNDILCRFLRLAATQKLLSTRGILYVKVNTLSLYKNTLDTIKSGFNAELLALKEMPAKSFVADYESFYEEYTNRGDIILYKRGHNWFELNLIFKLTMRA
jgi:release factor glutamine methyltransferase